MNDGIVRGQTYGQDNKESTLPWALKTLKLLVKLYVMIHFSA